MVKGHPPVYMKDFQILTKGFNYCKFKRKNMRRIAHKKTSTNTKCSRALSNAWTF